ncbi:MAG: hypothetical protein JNL77_03090 [Nitrosomonas sp.]|nr:hypothetical protein [Nitrosomonas sp.]
MGELDKTVKVEFWIDGDPHQFAQRRMYYVPRIGEFCVFQEKMRPVIAVVWCLDEDATERGVKVEVTLGAVR